ncbi:glycine betaine ABC transporter substrate-binding protein [Janibacter cremeus]|uniref:Osmoprotectant transport system substrate-binding protein n=1 Tax=Janibacter cremeus TaxID=1285192 RepID=A0A852VZ63_9MICO|nr:glycine betaine ABC transporter substrate-binding protein [Janibacter cremeus]NYF98761.1 osmoprotectant transport system substrate-binding protein [Janibacter cremeus]
MTPRPPRTPEPSRPTRRALLLTGAGILGLGLTGCGLGTSGGFVPSGQAAGPIADVDLSGAKIAVGSKEYTEQLILGKLAVILLSAAGADVTDLTNIPGSSSARQAMLEGQVQMQWEYTGTAWIAYMGESEPIPDEQKQYEAVRDRDLKDNDLVWLPPAPMNNTYGFAGPREKLEELGVTKLSDLGKVPKDELTFCVESEFNNRNDGFVPMLKTYGLTKGKDFPENNVKVLGQGAIYQATDDGLCTFGEVFTTDGRIKALDLLVLKDDKGYFPKYNVAPVLAKSVVDQFPQVADLFAPVTDKLTSDVMIDLNASVDVDGEDAADVAFAWLEDQGFITG